MPCTTLSDCAPVDACLWAECLDGACEYLPRVVQADLGGSNGSCIPDASCDGNDRFHALNCFSNIKKQVSAGDQPVRWYQHGRLDVDGVFYGPRWKNLNEMNSAWLVNFNFNS